MRVRRPLFFGVILTAVVALAAGCTPSPVKSATFGDARLGLQGASVRLPLRLQCQQGWNIAFGDFHVAQNNDGRLAQGFGFFENEFPGVPCTGSTQTVNITVQNSSPWVFRRGEAAADGIVTVFNENQGQLVDKTIDPQEIDILSGDSLSLTAPAAQPTRDPRYPDS